MRIGILDHGLVHGLASASQVLREMVALMPVVDELGYSRFWLSEHHDRTVAYGGPEILVPALASASRRIRVGTAGILMQFHSPLRVAEAFLALAALYPGRIDAGLAAGMTHEDVREALSPGFDLEEATRTRLYTRRVRQVLAYFHRAIEDPSLHRRDINPIGQQPPPVVLLGSGKGRGNMVLAAEHGTAFCYALFQSGPGQGVDTLAEYRDAFRPSRDLAAPYALVAANFICGETDAEALALLNRMRLRQPLYTPHVLGSPKRCRERIAALLDQYGAEEMIVIPAYPDVDDKRRGYELLAEECGLRPAN